MGIILYIGNKRDIADNIDNIQTGSNRLTMLNLSYNFKHYIEEYMPDYILLSEDADSFEEISDYVSKRSKSRLIITGNKKPGRGCIPEAVRIECEETRERFQKIIETIDILDPVEKKDKRDYKFLKQEVISFYSVQGGAGKTSIAFNTAYRLKVRNMGRVLLVDLNFCEGPSDLQINLDIDSRRGLGDFADDVMSGGAEISKNISGSVEGIDILCPPMSLYQSDKFSIEMLDSLIYSARDEYDLIITDLPFRYDNISLEMINISTTSVLVMAPELRLVPRIKGFNKFLPENQKKMAVLNKAGISRILQADELEDMTGLTLCARVQFIAEKDRSYIEKNGRPTGIIDLQKDIDGLIGSIF